MYVQSFASTMGSCIKKGFVSLYHLYCDTKSLIKARVEGYADNTAIRSKNSLILYLSFTFYGYDNFRVKIFELSEFELNIFELKD